ncbi:MAG TPA: hypothetical protein DDW29_03520 [Gammaproteobacteria bacterium]|nr:hypothetical protein [Gammaproteobacteria bacterium]|tara:strand:- start:496 stop:741 length:246 start_codon:yes stop_codon:yes gene_type:complete
MKLYFGILIAFYGPLVLADGNDVAVDGYTRENGTYVEPHYRSEPNNTDRDNWSTKGNVNPYTGERGTKNSNDRTSFSSDER